MFIAEESSASQLRIGRYSHLSLLCRWSEVVQFSVGPFDFPDFVGRARAHISLYVLNTGHMLLMYVGVVVLLRNLPLYGGRFDSPPIRDLESRRDVLTGQSAGWALVYATSRRSLRLLCGEYGQLECKT